MGDQGMGALCDLCKIFRTFVLFIDHDFLKSQSNQKGDSDKPGGNKERKGNRPFKQDTGDNGARHLCQKGIETAATDDIFEFRFPIEFEQAVIEQGGIGA